MEKDGEMALLIEMKIDDNINDADGVLLRELNAIKGWKKEKTYCTKSGKAFFQQANT